MITVIVADDHEIVRESIRQVLDNEPDIRCVGLAGSGKEALQIIQHAKPNIAIVDVNMPDMDGIETTRRIRADYPDVAVLILTAYDYQRYVVACIEAGASGYLLKTRMPCDGLVNAVRMVHRGTGTFDLNSVIGVMRKALEKGKAYSVAGCELSEREMELLSLTAKGMTSKQIGLALRISEVTVNGYFANILRKLNVQSRVEAVMLAMKSGWISDDT